MLIADKQSAQSPPIPEGGGGTDGGKPERPLKRQGNSDMP